MSAGNNRRATDVQTSDILVRVSFIEPSAMGHTEGEWTDVEITHGAKTMVRMQSDSGVARGVIVDLLNEMMDEAPRTMAIERLGRKLEIE